MRLDCPECGSTRIQATELNEDLSKEVSCSGIDWAFEDGIKIRFICRDCHHDDELQFVNAGDRTLVQWVESDRRHGQLDKQRRSGPWSCWPPSSKRA